MVSDREETAVGGRVDAGRLLCEGCGYPLDGLEGLGVGLGAVGDGNGKGEGWEAGGGRCPECGRAIWSSVGARRVGSRWQRGPGLWTWVRTNAEVVWSPVRVFGEVRVGGAGGARGDSAGGRAAARSRWLLLSNALVGGVAGVGPWAWGSAMGRVEFVGWGSGGELVLSALGVGSALVAAWVGVVMLLCEVERAGLGFFGRQRGWRVTRGVSGAVVAHASVGWLLGGVLLGALALAPEWVRRGPNWLDVPVFGDVLPVSAPLLPAAAFLAGMLVFETLTAVGVRRMRYANVVRG